MSHRGEHGKQLHLMEQCEIMPLGVVKSATMCSVAGMSWFAWVSIGKRTVSGYYRATLFYQNLYEWQQDDKNI